MVKGTRVKSVLFLSIIFAAFVGACGLGTDPDDLGSCSVDCGNFLEGIDITQYTFITLEDCIQKGEEASCTATYCPPEGEGECSEVFDP